MPNSFMQHQREIDRASDIELEMEQVEQDMRDELLSGGYIEVFGTTFGQAEVIEQMNDLDSDGFDTAVMQVITGNVEGVRQLVHLSGRAVEQIIGLAKVREEAEARLNTKEAA